MALTQSRLRGVNQGLFCGDSVFPKGEGLMRLAVVVDDNPADRLVAATLLKHAGYKVMVSQDGRAGLDLILKERPDLIIADLITPNVDGYDLARAVRFDPQTSATPMVLQTAHYLEAEVRQLAAQIGVQEVIIKPYEPQAFLDAITKAVRGKSALKAGAPAFDFEHMLLVSAKLYEKVREVEATRAQLEATATKYQLLFEAHPEPLWVFDLETRCFLEANEAAIQTYGYSRDDFMAMTMRDLDPPEAQETSAQTPLTFGEPGEGVLFHRKRDGSVIEVQITTHDLTYGGRNARYVMAQDVTAKHLLAQKLHQMQRVESLGKLAAGVAHDFNNVLGVIMNFAWFVKANFTAAVDSGEGERWRPVLKDVERIERAAEHAARLTRQLLAFAREEVVRPRPMNVNSVVLELAPLLQRMLGEHIELVTSLSPDLQAVMIDPGQLSQVLTNLAVNSRDAMPKGGTLTIDTENVDVDATYTGSRPGLKSGRYVRVRVSDTGTGMDKNTLQHAFEPFFTTKPRGQGTGLGLATIHGIVAQAGGRVSLYAEPGRGTRASVLLPITNQTEAPELPAFSPRARANETVLVVEDQDDLREIAGRILSQNGYQVMAAANGPEAIQMLREHTGHIDLLLTDVIMPQMLGTELAPLLVHDRPDLRVLFMSGYAQPAPGSNGTFPPDGDLLDKPFTEPTLLARVRQALEGKP
jgi:PAS domain S-box-containing protein